MVRLKVLNVYYSYFIFYISIPYGAIKSSGRIHSRRHIIIFQFLMVRLKELWKIKKIENFLISIPYGAIKSKSNIYK